MGHEHTKMTIYQLGPFFQSTVSTRFHMKISTKPNEHKFRKKASINITIKIEHPTRFNIT
jgi:hypothetical protein